MNQAVSFSNLWNVIIHTVYSLFFLLQKIRIFSTFTGRVLRTRRRSLGDTTIHRRELEGSHLQRWEKASWAPWGGVAIGIQLPIYHAQ